MMDIIYRMNIKHALQMKEYIFASRDDIYIIDLQKTAKLIEEAYIACFFLHL